MKMNRQQGMTMWGVMVIALLIAFFALLGIKIFPIYMTDMKIKSALEGVAKQSINTNMTNIEIREAMRKRLEIDNADSDVDLKTALIFEKRGRTRIARIQYESIAPLFYNLSILAVFDHSEETGGFQ